MKMRSLPYLIGQKTQERYEEDIERAEKKRSAGMKLAKLVSGLDVPSGTAVHGLPVGSSMWDRGWNITVPTLEGARALVFQLLGLAGKGKFEKIVTPLPGGPYGERVLCYAAKELVGAYGSPSIDVVDQKISCRRVTETMTYNKWVCDI